MSKSWKDGLLSSGLPLEYEVSNILFNAGFHVDGEQPYTRHSSATVEEFSVDLHANHYVEDADDKGKFKAQLKVLSECKYRVPGKNWVFMPDLNDGDFSPSWPGVIRFFPNFATHSFDQLVLKEFAYKYPSVFKGVELNINGSECFDKDIRHALNQLRYVLPETILNFLYTASRIHPDDCKPFFILPLLVTNAPLWVLKESVDLEAFRKAEQLEDIANSVGAVDVHSPHAEDFRSHCKGVFRDVDSLVQTGLHQNFRKIEQYNFDNGNQTSPIHDLKGLKYGVGPEPSCFTQFLVVNLASLPVVLRKAKTAVKKSLKNSEQFIFLENKRVVPKT